MEIAIVTDTSRALPSQLYKLYNIYPLGYYLEDSKGTIFAERVSAQEVQTDKLLTIAEKDKNAQLYSPTVKDFVELYTFLEEDFDHIISFHSSLFTPTVFENAILAKKVVSDITVDVLDTYSFESSSGLILNQLAKKIQDAESINEIRKESFSLHGRTHSQLLTKNDQFNKIGLRRVTFLSNIKSAFVPWNLYLFKQSNWDLVKNSRSIKTLQSEMETRLISLEKSKDLKFCYYSSSKRLNKEVKELLEKLDNLYVEETPQTLVSYFLTSEYSMNISVL
ncbi:MAG: DegV family protein [Candidatus Heimdallarchaeaceae archaeon]